MLEEEKERGKENLCRPVSLFPSWPLPFTLWPPKHLMWPPSWLASIRMHQMKRWSRTHVKCSHLAGNYFFKDRKLNSSPKVFEKLTIKRSILNTISMCVSTQKHTARLVSDHHGTVLNKRKTQSRKKQNAVIPNLVCRDKLSHSISIHIPVHQSWTEMFKAFIDRFCFLWG